MNVRTGLVSNADVRMRKDYRDFEYSVQLSSDRMFANSGLVLEDLGILSYLDPVLLSETEGIEKPSREIFLRACSRVNINSNEVVHVGDELKA